MTRVLMAMSGGIDSGVAALLLRERGYDPVGATLRICDAPIKDLRPAHSEVPSHDRDRCRNESCGIADPVSEAKLMAEQLGIEHHVIDARAVFQTSVIQNFIEEYLHGHTPNPCVLCNPAIKWGMLSELADRLHCDCVATGHYARIQVSEGGHYYLQRGKDKSKDQSYFLWRLSPAQLERTIFPLGDLTKEQVRETAARYGFPNLTEKKESEEICFIPENDYRRFLEMSVPDLPRRHPRGDFVSVDGRVLGTHQGLYKYTIGQRKGLGIALGTPAYVVALQPDTNRVVLGTKEDLLGYTLCVHQVNLLKYPDFADGMQVLCKIRYRSPGAKARLFHATDHVRVEFEEPVESITPGQSAVFYEDEDMVGGGVILKTER